MIGVQSFNKSLKIQWLKGYLDGNNQGKWKFFVDVDNYLEKHCGKLVFSANLKRLDTPVISHESFCASYMRSRCFLPCAYRLEVKYC